MRYRLDCTNLAIALHAVGDILRAHQTLREAKELANQQSTYWVDNVNATQVSFWIAEGNLDAASQWAMEQKLDIDEKISYQNQLQYRTLAHLRVVQGQGGDKDALDEAIHLLPCLVELFEIFRSYRIFAPYLNFTSTSLSGKNSARTSPGISE